MDEKERQRQLELRFRFAKAKESEQGAPQEPSIPSPVHEGSQGHSPSATEMMLQDAKKESLDRQDAVRSAVYGLPLVGPLVGKAQQLIDPNGAGGNDWDKYYETQAEKYPAPAVAAGIVAPNPMGRLGAIGRMVGAGADAAERAYDQGQDPLTAGGIATGLQGAAEAVVPGIGKAINKAAPHVNEIANGILSKFLGLSPDDIERLAASGHTEDFMNVMKDNKVLQPGQARQGAYNAAKGLERGAEANLDALRLDKTAPDLEPARALLGDAQTARKGLYGVMTKSSEGLTQTPWGSAMRMYDAVGQRIQSTAGLGAKSIAQEILNKPLNLTAPDMSKFTRTLQIIADSDTPEVMLEVAQQDPEFNRQLNEARKKSNDNEQGSNEKFIKGVQ